MVLADWIALITAALKFPAEVMQFIALFQKTPEEKRQDLMAAIQQQADSFASTGRPTP